MVYRGSPDTGLMICTFPRRGVDIVLVFPHFREAIDSELASPERGADGGPRQVSNTVLPRGAAAIVIIMISYYGHYGLADI